MKTCSETIKACGFKSTKQVAEFNLVTSRTVQLCFKGRSESFKGFLVDGAEAEYMEKLNKINTVLNGAKANAKEGEE